MRNTLFAFLLCLIQVQLIGQLVVQSTVAENQNCNGVDCAYEGPSILINEIMLAPPYDLDGSIYGLPFGAHSGREGEWIELFNPDECKPVDVSCFYLGNNTYSYDNQGEPDFFGGGLRIPDGTIVPPLGFLLIRGPRAAPLPDSLRVARGGKTVELVVDSSMVCIESGTRLWFPNAGGWFAFYNREGIPQDAVSWAGDSSAYGYKPCVAQTTNCLGVDSLASYTEIPANRKNYITNTVINYSGLSFRRMPDGGSWRYAEAVSATYGTCNDTCFPNQEISCTGSISLEVNGGTPPYEVLWDDSRAQRGTTARSLCAGTYCAAISDANGNTISHCATITDFEPTIAIQDPGLLCENIDSVQLDIVPSQTMGDSASFNGPAINASGVFSPFAVGEGLYNVSCYYETASGCSTSAQRDIRVAKDLPLELHVLENGVKANTLQYCEQQGPATLVLDGLEETQNSFTLGYAVLEEDGFQNYPSLTLSKNNNRFQFDSIPGNYTIQITEVQFGSEFFCASDVNTVDVTIHSTPKISIGNMPSQFCQRSMAPVDIALEGRAPFRFTVTELSGKDDSTYTFTGDSVFVANLSPQNTGQHQYQISGLQGGSLPTCFSDTVLTFNINVVQSPVASITGSGTWCSGAFYEAFVSINNIAEVMLTYAVDGIVDSIPGSPPGVLIRDSLSVGEHTLELLAVQSNTPSACTGLVEGSYDISILPIPAVNAYFTPNPSCKGDPIDFNLEIMGNGPFEVDIVGDNQQPQTVTTPSNFQISEIARQGLMYTISEIRDNSQAIQNSGMLGPCVAAPDLDVIADVHALPSISLKVSDDTICQGESVDLTFVASGAEPFDLQYRLGDADIQRSNIPARFTETVTPTDSTTEVSITQLTDNNGCSPNALPASIHVVVNPNPSPNVSATTRNSCIPLNTQLRFQEGLVPLTSAIYRSGNQRATGINGETKWIFDAAGNYDLSGTLVSTEACTTRFSYADYFEVHPFPKADFGVYPPVISEETRSIQFSDASTQEAQSWQWQFSNGEAILSESERQNPFLNMEMSRYDTLTVQLISTSEFNCSDTTLRQFIIEPPIAIYVPSAVTANRDQLNDAFAIAISNSGLLEEFKFQIFNRWGDLVKTFQKTDFEWNPDQYQGSEVENGLYVWRMQYRLHGNSQYSHLQGVIHVLR